MKLDMNKNEYIQIIIAYGIGILALIVSVLVLIGWIPKTDNCIICGDSIFVSSKSISGNIYAVHVSTNLVSVPCKCGFCDPERGVRVPEHINQIGYDLKYEVSTSYYPVVILKTNNN